MSIINLLNTTKSTTAVNKTPIVQDSTTQIEVAIECVERTFRDSISRLRIALLLPLISDNFESFRKALTGTIYEPKVKLFEDYIAFRKRRIERRSPQIIHQATVQLIDHYLECHKMYDILPSWKRNLQHKDKQLLETMEMLGKIAHMHLHIQSHDAINIERKLHSMYDTNAKLKDQIKKIDVKLKKKKKNAMWKNAIATTYINKVEADYALKKQNVQMHISARILFCQHELRTKHKIFLESHKDLMEELQKVEEQYQKVRAKNLISASEARNEKNKVLLLLEGQLKKYDQVIGEKLRENVALEDELQEWKKKIKEFMVFYKQEEAVYNEIIVKREEEERQNHEQRILLFRLNHAARIIQRYFRNWLKWQRKKAKMFAKKRKLSGKHTTSTI